MKLDPSAPECNTPLMKQFLRLKEQAGDCLLFFRMGDFYELFGDDAVIAAPILGITLTSRDKNRPNPIPMAGIPYHSGTGYIQKLLNVGRKVAIAEQVIPDGMTIDQIKGIVDRQISRVFTPAVQFEMGENSASRYLATLLPDGTKNYTLCLFDPATGEVLVSKPSSVSELQSENALFSIRHFLNSSAKTPPAILGLIENLPNTLIEEIPSNLVSSSDATAFLQKQYEKSALHPILENDSAKLGLALLIQYVLKTQGLNSLPHLKEPKSLHEGNRLKVGPNTHLHLDTADLFTLINSTSTSMGSRRLRAELESPLKDVSEITLRQKSIQELAAHSLESAQIQTDLKEVYDLDRILGRVATRLASPRDTYALGLSLQASFQFLDRLAEFKEFELCRLSAEFADVKIALTPITEQILKTQKADAPTHTREGGIFELGTDPDLDRLIKLTTEGERFLVELEMREREQTGISSLKVKYNRVFGYFIEISSANLKNVPAHYQRKQTTVGGERFFTEELKKFEEEILSASQKQRALESKLFEKLTLQLVEAMTPLKLLSHAISELDAYLALAKLAHSKSWCFPVINEGFELKLVGSRHPVVDQALRGEFVANDISLSPEARTLLITGPNMGGKSTVMRQIAQIILLGQIGAPVPAREATWGVFHSIYTRIGAQDAISKGQSTFMVEMVELAHILNHADSRSFIVLDEIGRGTSTFDGMSVAHASLEHLHVKSGARIVFATHYHELTELEAELPGLKNAYMKVLDQAGKLTFLYEIALGRSSKSFGIQVAELAGLPKAVIKKSWEILKNLEANHAAHQSSAHSQLSLFMSHPEEVATTFTDESELLSDVTGETATAGLTIDHALLSRALSLKEQLEALDVNHLRPIEALQYISDLRDQFLAK